MKKAFTLAEVLITLGIIGVVAAITLSSLITNIRNRGYVEKFKKAYSTIQQATLFVERETGISAKDFQLNNKQEQIYIYGLYAQYLNLGKTINYVDDFSVDTEVKTSYQKLKCKFLNGTEVSCSSILDMIGYPFPQLEDGTVIVFRPTAINSAHDWGTQQLNAKAAFAIDVNGPQKPNQLGRDIFRVYLHNSGKIYAPNEYKDNVGWYGPDCDPKAEVATKSRGYSCAYRILTEGKMNY